MKSYFNVLALFATACLCWSFSFQNYSPKESVSLQDPLKESMARGKELYMELCVTCHLADGKGQPGAFPPLAGSDYIKNNPYNAIYPQKFGLSGKIVVNGKTYNVPMAAPGISDEEVADITNYIMNSWGNSYKKLITVKEVAAVKKKEVAK